MSIQFIKVCNYLNEANIFLGRYFNNLAFEDLHKELSKKSGYTSDIKTTLNAMEKIYAEILNEVNIPKNLSVYYEMEEEEDVITGCLADCIMWEGVTSNIQSLSELRIYMKESFHKNPVMFVNSALRIQDEPVLKLSNDEFMEKLEKLEIKDSIKWNIWRVYNNYDEHLDRLMDTIEIIIPVMMRIYQKYKDCFTPFYDYWKKIIEDHRFVEQFRIMLKIDFFEEANINVIPSWMGCNSVRLNMLFSKDEQMYLFLGLIFKDEGILVSNSMTREEICTGLKILSDASKYEIMNLIKKDRLYGSQLAERLGLSTATISHHVNALASAGLITLEKDSNRVYYRMNKTQVGYLLDQLRKDLYD